MKQQTLPTILLSAFVFMAVFGLYLPSLTHGGHEMGCPFAPGSAGQCAALLEHAAHWQSAITGIIKEFQLPVFLSFVLLVFLKLVGIGDPKYERYRHQTQVPQRPPLMQVLFSQGIMHRKEPQIYTPCVLIM